jgi:hypothetical protein
MKKKIYKNKMKFGEPYKICKNCKGNGYVRIIPYSETQSAKSVMEQVTLKMLNEPRIKTQTQRSLQDMC